MISCVTCRRTQKYTGSIHCTMVKYTKQNGRPLHGVPNAAHMYVMGDVTVLIVTYGIMYDKVCKCPTGKATYQFKTSRVR